MDASTDIVGLQDITRIWSSFHFLPRDLYAPKEKCSKLYRNKFRLICGPNGDLAAMTVELAKGRSLQAAVLCLFSLGSTKLLVIIYCMGLLYSAFVRVVSAFRKTAIAYIP